MADEAKPGTLTPLIATTSDLNRARRDLEAIDDFLLQASIRQPGAGVHLPQVGRRVERLASELGVNLLQEADRKRAIDFIRDLSEHAPVIHFSFASEPSTTFIGKLVSWLRDNIHPQAIMRVGLQPSIAAGCIVRTTNRQFDFSLAAHFDRQRGQLIPSLKASSDQATEAGQAQGVQA